MCVSAPGHHSQVSLNRECSYNSTRSTFSCWRKHLFVLCCCASSFSFCSFFWLFFFLPFQVPVIILPLHLPVQYRPVALLLHLAVLCKQHGCVMRSQSYFTFDTAGSGINSDQSSVCINSTEAARRTHTNSKLKTKDDLSSTTSKGRVSVFY